jgi:hypothetical protein
MHENQLLSTMDVLLSFDYTAGDGYLAAFLRRVASRDLPHERRVWWDTTASHLEDVLDHATLSSELWWGSAALLDLEAETGCLAIVAIRSGVATIQLVAETADVLVGGESWIRRRIPERLPADDRTIPAASRPCRHTGARKTSRSLPAPT